MTTVASVKSSPVPNLEFLFKVVGKCISCISSPGRQKSYRLEHILKFIERVQPGLTHCFLPSRSDCKGRVEKERELCGCFTRCNHLLTYIIHQVIYHDRKASDVIKKLREDPNEIPSQSRDTITVMAYNLFREKSCQILM